MKIYIEECLHLFINLENGDSIQAWIEDRKESKWFMVEYNINNKTTLCEYDNKELWLKILKEIDNKIK